MPQIKNGCFEKSRQPLQNIFLTTEKKSGENEIRTRDTLLAYTRFPGVPLQPLEHLSLFFNKKTDNGNIFSTKEIAASKLLFSAERQGFEPRVPRGTTVFKTAAIDHSATSPKLPFQKCFSLKAVQRYELFLNMQEFPQKKFGKIS